MQKSDFLKQAGKAALGARLRRLSENIDRDASRTYSLKGVEFEQRWFGILNQILLNGPMSVGDISDALRITHVSVSQSRKSLERKDYVASRTDAKDSRRKLIYLTKKGQDLVKDLRPLWDALNEAAIQIDEESGGLLEKIEKAEKALKQQTIYDRVQKILENK